MTFPVLLTKLARPRPPAHVVARGELWRVLSTTVHAGQRITFICAPAGYGKSTLVSTWLEHTQIGPVAWLSLDAHDDHLDQFLATLQAAIAQIYPDINLAAGRSPLLQGDAAYRVFCINLLNAVAAAARLSPHHEPADP
jgi:LuxR family transcriptional regulator, maltose regulon positive regulatory protein